MPNSSADKSVVNILMIDDKKENLYSLRSLLDDGSENINFLESTSGNEALKIALREELALILLDVQMPDMDGYEVARLLKLNKKTRDIPIIFVTALNQDTTYVLEGYEKGGLDYLFKPLNPAITKAKVNAFIQMYRNKVELELHRQALIQANETLEQKVLERTADLNRANEGLKIEISRRESIEKDLIKTNTRLTKINADLDSFVYTASHDLKMPVANMEGLLKVLTDKLKSTDDEMVKNVLGMLESSVEQFKTTIHELLQIIKNQKSGKEEAEVLDCNEIIEEIKASIKEVIESSSTTIRTDFDNCEVVKLSRQELKSIFYNLITNAIKYRSPDRLPEVLVKTKKLNNYLMLSVQDNGLGVDEESKGKMFSMFERLHDHVEGTGIGLYIVKNIINKYEGSIEVDSEPEQGTEFRIKLPL